MAGQASVGNDCGKNLHVSAENATPRMITQSRTMFFLWYVKTLADMTDRHLSDHGILVLFEGEAAKKSHQGLFALPDASYRAIRGSITRQVIAIPPAFSGEIHVVGGWETILQAALWSRTGFPVGDACTLLKKSGMTDEELYSLQGATLHDIFFWLCREEKLELLRRICNAAKANVESRRGGRARVHCHLVSDGMEKIVASSL
jgi:hypothetical protein